MEFWDLYDENRNPLPGRPLHRRGDPVPEGCYHLVVHVWLLNSRGQILSTRRDPSKDWPLMWECTGGSALAGEDSLTAALREVKEETGLTLDPSAGKVIYTRIRADSIVDVWLFRGDFDLSQVILQPGETVDAALYSPDEIRSMRDSGEFFPYGYLDWFLTAPALDGIV